MPTPWPKPCPWTIHLTLALAAGAKAARLASAAIVAVRRAGNSGRRKWRISRATGSPWGSRALVSAFDRATTGARRTARRRSEAGRALRWLEATKEVGMATQTVEAVDHKLLVAGEWGETGEWGEVKSPYDGSPVGRVALGDAGTVDRAVRAAREAFESAD